MSSYNTPKSGAPPAATGSHLLGEKRIGSNLRRAFPLPTKGDRNEEKFQRLLEALAQLRSKADCGGPEAVALLIDKAKP